MKLKTSIIIPAVWLFISANLLAQVTGVMPWFNAGNNYGEVQDSVYNRDPIFAFKLEPDSSILIDGIVDPSWELYPVFSINRVFFDVGFAYSPAPSLEDFSAKTRFAWDEDNLYILIEVKDDTIIESEKSVRQVSDRRDVIDIYWGEHFPYNPARMGTDIAGLGHWAWNADDGDRQYMINCGSDSIYDSRTDFTQVANETVGTYASNIDFVYVNHGSMYTMEIKLPWDQALGLSAPVNPGDFFSFDITAEDLDTEGNERSHKIAINSLWNNVYAWRFYSGKLTLLPPILEQSNRDIIRIEPLNTTGHEPITITLDPSLACVPEWDSSGLEGVPQIGMHSSAVLVGEPDVSWNHWVGFDGLGYDGTEPTLLPNGDGTYSITITPSEFYGTGDAIVKGLSIVFNNSVDWTQSARAYGVNGCKDFYVTLSDLPVNANALLLDGADDFIVLNNVVDDMIEDNAEYTFECWVKPEYGILFAMNYGVGDGENNFVFSYAGIFMYYGWPMWGGTTSMAGGQWYHFAATVDQYNNGKIYVNGIQSATFWAENRRAVTGSRLSLGMEYDYHLPSEHLAGIVDDVIVWKKARTPQEIFTDLRQGASPSDPDMLAWYTFEDISNNVVFDNSSYNNLGVLNGNPRLVPSYIMASGSPGAPVELKGFPSQSSVALTWASQTNVPGESYNIYLGEDYQGSSAVHQFRVIGLEPETNYNIYVSAISPLTGEESEKSLLAISTLSLTPVLPALTPPVIDGQVDAGWNSLSTTNLMDKFAAGESESEGDLSASFRTMWDQDALYIMVNITDDSVVWDTPGALWDFDGMEIYLDMGNEKVASGYDTNDVQLRFRYNHSDMSHWYNGQPEWVDTGLIEFADYLTPVGYNLEYKFPWSAIRIDEPAEGLQLGLEITINDNDGNFREAILAWNAISDDAWNHPSVWGTMVLVNEDTTLNLFFDKDDSHSDLPEGRARVRVQGGSPPYSYLWSTGDTLDAIRNLYPGTYTVNVSDNEGNAKSGSVIIQDLGSYYTNCQPGYKEITVNIMTDNFGGETMWDLRVADTTYYRVLYESYGNNTLYATSVCVPVDEEITFTIRDYGGDGICCLNGNGYYSVESSCAVLLAGDEFSSFESGEFTLTGIEVQAEFRRILGDPGLEQGIKAIQTCEGQFATIGHTDSRGAGKKDILLIKMDGRGDTLWTQTYGTSDAESAVDILQAADGGFLILALWQSGTSRYPLLIKTDPGGAKVWEKSFTYTPTLDPLNVKAYKGGYMVLARDPGTDVATLLHVDAGGDSLWSMTDEANPRYLATTADSGFAILYSSDGMGDWDVKIRKFDKDMTLEWSSVIHDTAHQIGYCLEETFENDFIISGETYSDGGDMHLYVLKVNGDGNKIWSKSFGPGTSPSLAETGSLEYIVAANRDGVAGLLKLDPNGNVVWEKSFSETGDDYLINSVTLTSDNGYVAAGKVTDETFIPDLWVFRTNQSGYGCFARPYEKEKICLVTIDSDTEKNMVVWEKTDEVGTDFFRILRETTTAGVYSEIGLVDYNSLSQFVDAGSDPRKQAYRYKISLIDTCGNESKLSDYHQPIHLQVSRNTAGGHNLDWSLYETESGQLTFKTHFIYGGTDSTGLQLLDSVSGYVFKYTDPRTISWKTRYYYRVEGVLFSACTPTGAARKAGTGPYSHSLSNLDDNKLKVSTNNAPTDISLSTNNIDEGLPAGTLIALLSTADLDTLDMHAYALVSGTGDDDNADFSIKGDSLLSARVFDYETETSLNIRIQTQDDGVDSLSYSKAFTININDVVGLQPNGYGPVSVYPNPMTGFATVRFRNTGNEEYTLFLRDVTGKMVRTLSGITTGEVMLERGGLESGYYSIEISGPSVFRGKLIVR